MNPLKRLFSYTFRFKFSFILSILGFVLFASADIAAVEWIRRIIEYINSDQEEFSLYLVLALSILAHAFAAARGKVIAKCTNSLSSKPLGQSSKHDRHAVLTWPW